MAKANSFRFSTKYQDDETDLLYYGYRYYNASTGRWMSRDLVGEQGGQNLYGFVVNDSISGVDPLGLACLKYTSEGRYVFKGHLAVVWVNLGVLRGLETR